jgi:hypothetical protein
MAPMKFLSVVVFLLPVLLLFAGCTTRAVQTAPPGAKLVLGTSRARAAFTGVPIVGDYDNKRDLDFVLRADSAGRVYKVRVHEGSHVSNSGLLRQICTWINEIEDIELVQVSGFYTPHYRADSIEYGALELREIAFQDTLPGFEEPYRTDPSRTVAFTLYAFIPFMFFAFSR